MILGIDPGLTGGLGIIDYNGNIVAAMRMPTIQESNKIKCPRVDAIREFRARHKPERVCMEQVHAMPRQGVSSVFTFGVGYGVLLAVTWDVRRDLVSPAKWKAFFGLGKDKMNSLDLARRLWPDAPLGCKADEGVAEALLIAEYCRREL